MNKLRIVVLISGSGSNLQAIIDSCQQPEAKAEVVAVISNRDGVKGLERARAAQIPAEVLNHREYSDREAFDAALKQRIDAYQPGLVVLAGFMRILTASFVAHYLGRMVNIHPSLLPKFPGLHTHRRALESGEQKHGSTVHFVTAELDGGPAIIQAEVPILANDTEESLALRVLEQEHQIYPLAVHWFASGRLHYQHGKAWLDGTALTEGGHPFSVVSKG